MRSLLAHLFILVSITAAIVHAWIHPIPRFDGELGIIENLTVLFLLSTLVVLAVHSRRIWRRGSTFNKTILVIYLVGGIYFVGEELSWGQHLLGLTTPEGYAALNKQGETNLHNLEVFHLNRILDKLPRTALTAGILLLGCVLPFLRHKLPSILRPLVPPGKSFFLPALMAVLVSVPEKIIRAITQEKSGFDAGELKELYIALFLLLYAFHFVAQATDQRTDPLEPASAAAS